MGSSLVTLLIVGAIIYYLFFMGGISQLRGMIGGGGGSNFQSQTSTQSSMKVNGADAQGIINGVQGNLHDMFAKVGIDTNQKNVSIQKRDDKGNNYSYQNKSSFASSLFASSRVIPRI